MIKAKKAGGICLLALLSLPFRLYGAPPQFEIDLKELDRKSAPAPKAEKKRPPKKRPVKKPARAAEQAPVTAPEAGGDYVRYRVRPGDHIFKILMLRFGMSNDAAERLVPEIVRINRIENIKTLAVGRTLLIPVQRRGERAEQAPLPVPAAKRAAPAREAAPAKETAPVRKEVAPVPDEAAPAKKASQAPAEPTAPVPEAVAEKPAPPSVPVAITWICSVDGQQADKTVDSLLNAISASWSRNRIVQSEKDAPMPFSIRVDRYFEYKGKRYIVSIGESDPYNYTLIRLLETTGYRVLRLTGKEDPGAVAAKLFQLVGVTPELGTHQLQEGGEAYGYLLRQGDTGGRQVLVVDGPAVAGRKWVLAPGCGAR